MPPGLDRVKEMEIVDFPTGCEQKILSQTTSHSDLKKRFGFGTEAFGVTSQTQREIELIHVLNLVKGLQTPLKNFLKLFRSSASGKPAYRNVKTDANRELHASEIRGSLYVHFEERVR